MHGENQYCKFLSKRELDLRLHFDLGHFSLSVVVQDVGVAHVYLRQVKIVSKVFLFFQFFYDCIRVGVWDAPPAQVLYPKSRRRRRAVRLTWICRFEGQHRAPAWLETEPHVCQKVKNEFFPDRFDLIDEIRILFGRTLHPLGEVRAKVGRVVQKHVIQGEEHFAGPFAHMVRDRLVSRLQALNQQFVWRQRVGYHIIDAQHVVS